MFKTQICTSVFGFFQETLMMKTINTQDYSVFVAYTIHSSSEILENILGATQKKNETSFYQEVGILKGFPVVLHKFKDSCKICLGPVDKKLSAPENSSRVLDIQWVSWISLECTWEYFLRPHIYIYRQLLYERYAKQEAHLYM